MICPACKEEITVVQLIEADREFYGCPMCGALISEQRPEFFIEEFGINSDSQTPYDANNPPPEAPDFNDFAAPYYCGSCSSQRVVETFSDGTFDGVLVCYWNLELEKQAQGNPEIKESFVLLDVACADCGHHLSAEEERRFLNQLDRN